MSISSLWKIGKSYFLLFTMLLGSVSLVGAHGLTISTANVTLRNQIHLTVRVQYDPLLLLRQTYAQSQKTLPPLPLLANMADEEFEKHYDVIKSLFQEKLAVWIDGKSMESPHFRFPATQLFRMQVREQFMKQVIDSQRITAHPLPDHDRHYYQTIELDGFLPRTISQGTLDIRFPQELGTIQVTFSQPIIQTLTPEQEEIRYLQPILLK